MSFTSVELAKLGLKQLMITNLINLDHFILGVLLEIFDST